LKNNINEFFKNTQAFWIKLAKLNCWVVIELTIVVQVIQGESVYYLCYPFGITTGDVNENTVSFQLTIGDANPVSKAYKVCLSNRDDQVSQRLTTVCGIFAEKCADYILENYKVTNETVHVKITNEKELVINNKANFNIAYYLDIFDCDREARSIMCEYDYEQDANLEALRPGLQALITKYENKHCGQLTPDYEKIPLIANWIAGQDEKLVIEYPVSTLPISPCATNAPTTGPVPQGGGKNKKLFSVLEKRVIAGKLRNVYKCKGDRKLYVRIDKQFVSLSAFKQRQTRQ
jgi:hypothetical protein